jgi:hypothetical protein
MTKIRVVGVVALLAGACAAESGDTILGFNGQAHLVTTRVGVALPQGRLHVIEFTPERYRATFTSGARTMAIDAFFTMKHTAVCDVTIDGDRHLRMSIDYLTGRISFDGNLVLDQEDIFNLARLDMAIGENDDNLIVERDDPRFALTTFINFVGMGYPGTALGGMSRQFDSLKLYDDVKERISPFDGSLVQSRPPADEPRLELPTMPADAVPAAAMSSFFGLSDPPAGLIAYPPYTGAKIGSGGTGVKCVAEGYYYPIGFDWRKKPFATRHVVNMYAPVMPRAYTTAQADSRWGFTCNGLIGPNCSWGTAYGWTLDALRHDTCVIVARASNTVSCKCGDELLDASDDAAAGSVCNGTSTYTTNRLAFGSWAPYYPGQPDVCGNDVCQGGETSSTCPADCAPTPTTTTSCGDGECGASETSSACPGDCGPPNCGDGTCQTTQAESATTCPDDCGGSYCGNGTCASPETATDCPEDCWFSGQFASEDVNWRPIPLTANTTAKQSFATTYLDLRSTPAPVTLQIVSGSCPFGVYNAGNQLSCWGGPELGNNLVVKMTRANGASNTITFTAGGEYGRISMWWGKVNIRKGWSSGTWQWDADCSSGANLDPLAYCRKFWPGTAVAEAVPLSTKSSNVWKSAGCSASYTFIGEREYICRSN